MTATETAQFDLVVFGATSFVGQILTTYLTQYLPSKVHQVNKFIGQLQVVRKANWML